MSSTYICEPQHTMKPKAKVVYSLCVKTFGSDEKVLQKYKEFINVRQDKEEEMSSIQLETEH